MATNEISYEHEDVVGLLELFQYHDNLHKKYKKVCKAIEKWDEMESQGTELKPAQEKQKGIDRENRKELLSLLTMITKILLKNEIVVIWNNKTAAWRDKIQKFTHIQTEINNKMLDNWKQIAVLDQDADGDHDGHNENEENH